MPLDDSEDPRSSRTETSELELEDLDDPYRDYHVIKEGMIDLPLEPLSDNIYGFVMASLILDSADVRAHPDHCLHSLRPFRICGAFSLCLVMFALQGFFVVEAKMLVTPSDVAHARKIYGKFEAAMYIDNEGKSHTWNTSNGFPRGYDGFFNVSNFQRLSFQDKSMACRVPLSQPHFLFGVLFIWTLTVMNHFRTTLNLFLRIMALETVPAMDGAIRKVNIEAEVKYEVVGLTCGLKAILVLFVQCPRVIMNCTLLWLGARWLTATLGFGDLLLNALALEFILNLSYLLYNTLVPYNGKLLVQRTLIPHVHRREHENCCNMFGMLTLGVLAATLCITYMVFLQTVLPGYRWDVHVACKDFLAHELAV